MTAKMITGKHPAGPRRLSLIEFSNREMGGGVSGWNLNQAGASVNCEQRGELSEPCNAALDRRMYRLVMFDVLPEHDPDTVDVAYGKFTNSIGLIRRS